MLETAELVRGRAGTMTQSSGVLVQGYFFCTTLFNLDALCSQMDNENVCEIKKKEAIIIKINSKLSCIRDIYVFIYINQNQTDKLRKYFQKYFPGGTVVKNPPANAGDTGSRALVREDPTCCGATKPVRHNY